MHRVSSQELKKVLFASLILQDSDSVSLSSYPVVACECKNCGKIKLFGRARLVSF